MRPLDGLGSLFSSSPTSGRTRLPRAALESWVNNGIMTGGETEAQREKLSGSKSHYKFPSVMQGLQFQPDRLQSSHKQMFIVLLPSPRYCSRCFTCISKLVITSRDPPRYSQDSQVTDKGTEAQEK